MMNRQFLSLVTAVLILIVAFTSCKKDSGGGGGEGNPFVINASNVINGNSDIATVKAMAFHFSDGNEYVLASGKYENDGFKLTLPATVPE
jgi:hypothetical protein